MPIKNPDINPPLRIPTTTSAAKDRTSPRYRVVHPPRVSHSTSHPHDPDSVKTGALPVVNEFLTAQLDLLEMAPDHSKSTGTRSPAYYDLHLDESLVLKKIIFVDDLNTKLAALSDGMTPSGLRKIKDPKKCPSIIFDSKAKEMLEIPIRKEDVLTEIYAARTGDICAPIAATIVLESEAWPPDVLKWVTETNATRAVADGFLVADPSKETLDALPSSFRNDLKALADHHLKRVGVWEFKSLKAAPESFMQGIYTELEGDFPWLSCENAVQVGDQIHSHSCGTGESQGKSHLTKMGRTTVSGRKTGPDSEIIACQLLKGSSRKAEASLNNADTNDLKRKRTAPHTIDTALPGKRSASNHQHPRSFHYCRGPDFWTSENLKRVYMLQQVWAEAVMNDATFLVIQAGNWEFIGVRARETQTLYLSSLIPVPGEISPPYNKVQLGLYIAAFADAIQRARKLDEILSLVDESLLPLYHKEYDFDSLKYPGHSNVPLTAQEKKKQMAEQACVDKILNYYLQHGVEIATNIQRPLVAEGIEDARLIRWQPTKPSTTSPLCTATKEGGTSIKPRAISHLDSRPGESVVLLPIGTELVSSGKVWRARLQIQGGTLFKKTRFREVVMKFARSSEEWKALQEEYHRYCQLAEDRIPNIVQTYGIFHVDSSPATDFHVLLMNNGGVSLSENNKKNYHKNSNYGTAYGDTILAALTDMHEERLLLAPSLTADHILVDTGEDSDDPSIIFLGVLKWKDQEGVPYELECNNELELEKIQEIKRGNRRLRDKDLRALL
ncbi:unnamed protein product [Cyclocybe aegerita]|uniref:Uncharacterized protein n=1 Tax=Cyclocybe aegerita TaxID=1973307 RepID=A0A8S0VZ13_CYCAE|nr:unnamed protein product [Cyclocybe aegerita]